MGFKWQLLYRMEGFENHNGRKCIYKGTVQEGRYREGLKILRVHRGQHWKFKAVAINFWTRRPSQHK